MNSRFQIDRNFAKKIMNEHIMEVVLFGLVARGDDTVDSDIDILIIADDMLIVEDKIGDEVINILLEKKEHISAHIISQEQYNKTKNFSFLRKDYEDGVILESNKAIYA